MRFSLCFLLFVSVFTNQSIFSQTFVSDTIVSQYKKNNEIVLKLNSLEETSPQMLKRGKNGLIIMPKRLWVLFPEDISFGDTVIYNPTFLPIVFEGKLLSENLSFLSKDTISDGYKLHLIPADSTFIPLLDKLSERNNIRRTFYANVSNIQNVDYNLVMLEEVPKIDESQVVQRNILKDLISAERPVRVEPLEMEQIQPELKYWQRKGVHSLQFSQNHISDNWYKGGNSSLYIRNYHKINLDYNKDKVSFNSVFEWRLGVQRMSADTLHKMSVNEDLVRLENTLNYKAFNHWAYSAKLETKTQLFNSYPVNSEEKNTALFAPLNVNLGLGMSYSLDKKSKNNISRKFSLKQSISPFSINFVYIADRGVDETKFGVDQGKRTKFELGSLINTDLSYEFNKFIVWTSRFRYFTNYHRVESELENKLDLSLNRYLSTNVILYLRYDDNVPKGDEHGFLQVNELISFGLSYKW